VQEGVATLTSGKRKNNIENNFSLLDSKNENTNFFSTIKIKIFEHQMNLENIFP